MESPLSEDWNAFLRLLISHRVKYLIVGGHAIAVHATARMTGDLDVFVEASRTNGRKILRALEAFGFGSVLPDLAEFERPGPVFMLGRPPFRIDILTRISGVDFAAAYASRVRLTSEVGKLNFIGREHLIANKRAAARAKDLVDLEALVTTKPPKSRRVAKRPR